MDGWSYVHEGATDKALDELRAGYTLAEAENDFGTLSGDLNLMGDVLREAGRLDEAMAKYNEAVTAINKAQVPDQVKDATRRNHLFEQARVAVAKKDLAAAKAKAAEYLTQVAMKKARSKSVNNTRADHRPCRKQPAMAAQEFSRANQQDPKILFLTAIAWREAGNAAKATSFATKAAKFNGLAFNYGYVRKKAEKFASSSTE